MPAAVEDNPDNGIASRRAAASPRSPRVKTYSLTERVYALLRAEILTCELEPGRELSEAELASRFEVSKTPVREALATLRSEGLVRTFPRRGYQVVPVTFGDINELFELRTILEVGAAELACTHITSPLIEQLGRLAQVVYDRSEKPSLKRFVQANRDFHLAIARASGNERIYQQLFRTLDELERFFYLGARLRDVSNETRDDHQDIVDTLTARDKDAARVIMIRHNELTRQGLIQQIATSKSFSRLAL